MTAPVVRNHTESLLGEEEHLSVPCVGTQRPSVRKRYDRALALVFVVDRRAIFYRNRAHMNFLLKFVRQNCSQFVVLLGRYQHRSAFVLHEEHDEFRRFGFACVPPNDVHIIRALVKGYLQDFDRVQKTAASDQELFDQMTELYPHWVANQSWLMFGFPLS
jgi:hypothetical protein